MEAGGRKRVNSRSFILVTGEMSASLLAANEKAHIDPCKETVAKDHDDLYNKIEPDALLEIVICGRRVRE